jgi:hypothetical protein
MKIIGRTGVGLMDEFIGLEAYSKYVAEMGLESITRNGRIRFGGSFRSHKARLFTLVSYPVGMMDKLNFDRHHVPRELVKLKSEQSRRGRIGLLAVFD